MLEEGRQTERTGKSSKRKKKGKRNKRGAMDNRASCVWGGLLRGAPVTYPTVERHLSTGDDVTLLLTIGPCLVFTRT